MPAVTYGELRDDLARKVAEGDLAPGVDLPGLRALAQERGATPATVARAVHELADAGVLETGERRRARVARDGQLAALRLLRGDRPFRLAGSDDPALDLLLRRLGDAVTLMGTRGSFRGLVALYQGAADGAVLHLRHVSGEYNAPFVRALLRGQRPALVRLWRREQGIVLPRGNPRGVAGIPDVARLRVADASVFPTMIGVNPCLTIMMVGERALRGARAGDDEPGAPESHIGAWVSIPSCRPVVADGRTGKARAS